jgi:hypothetical protein
MRNDKTTLVVLVAASGLLALFLAACFGAFGSPTQSLIVDLVNEARTQRIRVVE